MGKEEIATYAYENTEFYKEKWKDIMEEGNKWSWDELPIVSKKELVHAGIQAVSAEYYAKFGRDDIITDYTSGFQPENVWKSTRRIKSRSERYYLYGYTEKSFMELIQQQDFAIFIHFEIAKGMNHTNILKIH